MFSRVLVANRGAIAVRIIRTLKKLGIESIAIYAESDAQSLHVQHADHAVNLGQGAAIDTYLDIEKVLAAAQKYGAQAIHPGYGFLSENANFVRACEQQGIAFIGPTPKQMEVFGLKHQARALAEQAGVPLCPGTELLDNLEDALKAAAEIGYPIMLKSTAGGGGIGMQLCQSSSELESAFDSVRRLSANNFANDGVFVEKYIASSRHIEVQVFGDGHGAALAIGERDCSSQRRSQKVVEECPAPNLSDALRAELHTTAANLLSSINYRNAGTVEFIYDTQTDEFYFLEVNTRLQVEHGVTEEVYSIDLVEWMLQCAYGEWEISAAEKKLAPHGHSIQVRVYAEDPFLDFRPSAGLLSEVEFPKDEGLRIDSWVEAGVEIPQYFDPMIAKIIVHKENRDSALASLDKALANTKLYGCETNLDYLRALLNDPALQAGTVTTRYLNDFVYTPTRIDVLDGGTLTTIQDYPARTGHWQVGVPPSGPFDSYSFQLANRLLGNPEGAAGLEITMTGPRLQFSSPTRLVVTGADIQLSLDGEPIPMWQVVAITAGQVLQLGAIKDAGARSYVAIDGGIHCPDYLGSKSTFTLGQFGGHNGRALRVGDVLSYAPCNKEVADTTLPAIANDLRPSINNEWTLRVIYGPHGAPDFFTDDDIDEFFSHQWQVHYNSSRTGIRLIGPKPRWARADGGEAGLHPSNIHDCAYAFGTVDFTGDMPVILGPDGPSLGGFVCPATVIQADLWKLGQLRVGDSIKFQAIGLDDAIELEEKLKQQIASLQIQPSQSINTHRGSPILSRNKEHDTEVTYRSAGDHFLLIEYGEMKLDIVQRFRVHALMQWLEDNLTDGILELTPGIRSLQVHYDSQKIKPDALISVLQQAERSINDDLDTMSVESRIVHLPISWDDEVCQQASAKYEQSVRQGAPWCPDNLEFIRRINGLTNIDEVKQLFFDASFLVMGLGDVYLGAPVATPLDPRHRMVTTKYNPARTWTAENSVGIGGSYLCVYGMEGPGGYQLVGRTLQMWNRYKETAEFQKPWLLRNFDQVRFYEVTHSELEQIRQDFPNGRYPLKIETTHFDIAQYKRFLTDNEDAIAKFEQRRLRAFNDELEHWHATNQFDFKVDDLEESSAEQTWPEDAIVERSPVSGSVWQWHVEEGDSVTEGQTLVILESMKMEIEIKASCAARVSTILFNTGQQVEAGQAVLVLE